MKRMLWLALVPALCGLLFVLSEPPRFSAHALDPFEPGGGDPPPAGGSCARVNQTFPDDPFSGWPLTDYEGDWNVVTSWFCDPEYFVGYTHWGIDLGVAEGVGAVVTADRARVLNADGSGRYNSGMGNYVKVEALACHEVCATPEGGGEESCAEVCDPTGWAAIYMHLRDVAVQAGDELRRGDLVGHVDSTGNSTGHHLHYQINGPQGAVDPAPTMPGYDPAMRSEPRGAR